MLQLRIGKGLGHAVDRAGRNGGFSEPRRPHGARFATEGFDELGLLLLRRLAVRPLLRLEIGPRDELTEGVPEVFLDDAERDVAPVGAAIDVVAGCGADEWSLAAPRLGAGEEIVSRVITEPSHEAVGHRDVDELAVSRGIA